MKIETLRDLKNFLNGLNEAQLSQEAVLCLIDEGFERIADAYTTEEDYYVNDEGADPISSFEPYDEDDKLENYEILKAGHVYLCNE